MKRGEGSKDICIRTLELLKKIINFVRRGLPIVWEGIGLFWRRFRATLSSLYIYIKAIYSGAKKGCISAIFNVEREQCMGNMSLDMKLERVLVYFWQLFVKWNSYLDVVLKIELHQILLSKIKIGQHSFCCIFNFYPTTRICNSSSVTTNPDVNNKWKYVL